MLGVGTLSDEPVDGICTIPDVTEMRTDIDPLGIGQPTLAYHAHNLRFLSGARYQGAEFEATVDVTLGSCTGTYEVQALTPTQTGGTCITDEDCNPLGDPTAGRPPSGINPDFAVPAPRRPGPWTTSPGTRTSGSASSPSPFRAEVTRRRSGARRRRTWARTTCCDL